MKKIFTLMAAFLCLMTQAWADKVVGSTTLPENGRPEHIYTMRNGNSLYCGKTTAPTETEANYAQFAFYAVDGKANTYYIMYGDQYLTASYAKRKLALAAEPAEWVAENHKDGGVVLHHYVDSGFVTIGFAGAATNMIRCYKDSSGAMNTGIKGGLFFFKAN